MAQAPLDPLGPSQKLTFRVTNRQLGEIDALVGAFGTDRSGVLRRALEEFFDRNRGGRNEVPAA